MTTMRCLAAITALLFLLLGACQIYKPGGNAWFEGPKSAMTFYSTEDSPKTVTLVDIRSGERVFIMEIPAGKQLVLDFVEDNGDDPVNTPDLMKWEVFPIGTGYGALSNAMTVPNRWSRRLDTRIRPGIEYAEPEPDRPLRVDEVQDRPDWWTPQGGSVEEYDPVDGYEG